ncbi:MAG: hypothetical protein ACLFVJ_17720 [Persicimonas sp.]
MNPQRIAQLEEEVDQALEDGDLNEEAQRALIEVLTPDAHEQTWPDIEVVLHVAEHPVVRAAMEADRLAEPLEKAIIEAFSAVLPLLGIRAFGPLAQSTPRIRKQLEAERNKYELVRERLGEQDSDEDAIGLLRRYLSTEPAPLFVARFRQAHTKWIDEAERQNDAGADLVVLEQNAELVNALLDPTQLDPAQVDLDADAAGLREALEALRDNPDISQVTLRRGIERGSTAQRLVAAAVALVDFQRELAPNILAMVVAGVDSAAQLAVIAARLAPLMARNAFSQFLAEAAWQNPEEPEAQITAERTHAILAARCVLPKIGSPLDPVTADDVPDSADAHLHELPGLVDASWALWDALG